MRVARFLLLGLFFSFGTACGGVSDDDDDSTGDGDADSDADGDTDADSDADGDTDADGDADADADGDADVWTLERICDEVSAVMCESAAACCPDGWTADDLRICEDSFSLNCQAGMNAAVARGDVIINPDGIPPCMDAFRAVWAECLPFPPEPGGEACNNVFLGQLGEGTQCDSDESCIEELECAWSQDGESTCRRMPTDGEACMDGNCARGHRCNWDANVCYRLANLNEACQVLNEWTDTCQEELHCAGGVCRQDFGPGHACTIDRECLSNFCQRDGGGNNGTCNDGGGGQPVDYCDPSNFSDMH